MSNNGTLSNAGNGRTSANTKSISHKNDTKSHAATTTNSTLPERTTNKPINNENTNTNTHNTASNSTSSSSCSSGGGNNSTSSNHTTTIATHRRDKSSSINISAIKQHRPEVRQYQYARPQTLLNQEQVQSTEVGNRSPVLQSPVDEQLLVYHDGHIVSGTLEALVQHMVPTSDYYPERTFMFSFLLSGRLFVRPHELLSQISETWEQQQQQYQHQQQQQFGKDVVDDAAAAGAGAQLPISLLPASASPLTQRKKGMVPLLNDATLSSLERVGQQRTATQLSAQNCIRLLADWIETFPYDFRDERLMQQVRILARKCVFIDNSLGKQVSRILQMLVQRLTTLEKYEEFLQTLAVADLNSSQHQHYSTSAAASFTSNNSGGTVDVNHSDAASKQALTNTTNNISNPAHTSTHNTSPGGEGTAASHETQPLDIIDMCASCAQLAHQLTAIELERLSHIGPEEFVQAFAKEYHTGTKPGQGRTTNVMNSSSLNDMKKTRNLESYVEWFNRLSYLTASEIVKYPKKKQRVRIIEYWIETARECFNIGNFNSLMAIIAGLNLAPIARLKKTWSKVQSAKFSVLEHQMDPTSNFNSYRSTLKAAMWRSEGATDERERIIIPFFSLFVKDLYFLNESCSNRLPNNHINFEKCSQLAKQIMEFNEWKKVNCPFEKLPNVIAFLQNSPILNENTLSMASFECEPPENNEEKGRYKTVKAETKQQLLQQLQEQQQ